MIVVAKIWYAQQNSGYQTCRIFYFTFEFKRKIPHPLVIFNTYFVCHDLICGKYTQREILISEKEIHKLQVMSIKTNVSCLSTFEM